MNEAILLHKLLNIGIMEFSSEELKKINELLGDDKFTGNKKEKEKGIDHLDLFLGYFNVIHSKYRQYNGRAELSIQGFKKMLECGQITRGRINDDGLLEFDTNQRHYTGSISKSVHFASGKMTNSSHLVLIFNYR